jgi:hypothetical protein
MAMIRSNYYDLVYERRIRQLLKKSVGCELRRVMIRLGTRVFNPDRKLFARDLFLYRMQMESDEEPSGSWDA